MSKNSQAHRLKRYNAMTDEELTRLQASINKAGVTTARRKKLRDIRDIFHKRAQAKALLLGEPEPPKFDSDSIRRRGARLHESMISMDFADLEVRHGILKTYP